jgi:SHAQKYF class myb-like DNA-binding protein
MNGKDLSCFSHQRKNTDNSTYSYSSRLMVNTNEVSFSISNTKSSERKNSLPINEFWNDQNKTITEENESFEGNMNISPRNFGFPQNSYENLSSFQFQHPESHYGGQSSINSYSQQSNTIQEISTENKGQELKFNTGRWLQEEHQKFIEAMFLFGNEWKKVQEHIKTRSSTQARSHAQKFFIRLRKKFLEDYGEDGVKVGKINSRNEKLINLIKETVNCDVISNLFKNSGSNVPVNIKNLINVDKNVSNINNSSAFTNNNTNYPIIVPSNVSLDQFIEEKKEKFCRIVMNLIQNPSRTKKTSFSKTKEKFSEEDNRNININNNNNNSYNNISHSNHNQHNKKIKIDLDSESENVIMNPNSNVNNTNSNFFNPNLNNFISIVTINLGYNEKKKDNISEEKLIINEREMQHVNNNNIGNITNNCNIMSGGSPNINIDNKKNNNMLMFQKIIKPAKYNITSNNNVNISKLSSNCRNVNTPNTDGERILSAQDKNIDPFRLTFEENDDLGLNFIKNEDCDINKLNLDLDHIFTADNNYLN